MFNGTSDMHLSLVSVFFFFCIWLGVRGRYEEFLNPLDARSQHLKKQFDSLGKYTSFDVLGEEVRRWNKDVPRGLLSEILSLFFFSII